MLDMIMDIATVTLILTPTKSPIRMKGTITTTASPAKTTNTSTAIRTHTPTKHISYWTPLLQKHTAILMTTTTKTCMESSCTC